MSNNNETNNIIDMYYMAFNSNEYSLLPNNEKKEMEKEAEEKQKEILFERSVALSDLSEYNENNSFSIGDILLAE
jgi:TRAP-type C4-dicarboxylate transport system substrate-binding protein